MESIAIIGMSCHFPGKCISPERFWEFLLNNQNGIETTPIDRWSVDDVIFDDCPKEVRMRAIHGGFIDNARTFDAAFFGISPREAINMDPQQRLLLELSWQALEHAGIASNQIENKNIGTFIGISSDDYKQLISSNQFAQGDIYLSTGNTHSVAAGRISYILGLNGPTIAVDTACSSSLVALNLACLSINQNECDMAIVGGVNRLLSPVLSVLFAKMGMLSDDGRCKTFDASADGYVRGEGGGVVIIKKLSKALKDNDTIHAIIDSSAINHDGKSNGLTAPNEQAQVSLLQHTCDIANIAPSQVRYVEAHGTGTPLGDPIEIGALSKVYANVDNPLFIGSVKTNIGHLEAASGMASLIKAILILKNNTIPAQLHFNTPNPLIDWDKIPLNVVGINKKHRFKQNEYIGISSFGFSGTNAHVLIRKGLNKKNRVKDSQQHLVYPLSAKDDKALTELSNCYQNETNEISSVEVAYTLACGRTHFSHRMALVANSYQSFKAQLSTGQNLNKDIAKKDVVIAYMFSGQGCHYKKMGQNLYKTNPLFKKHLDSLIKIANKYADNDLSTIIFGKNGELLEKTEYVQPALFCLELALFKLLEAIGVKPQYVLGHSLGEYVAATVAGVMSVNDGIKLVCMRAKLMQSLEQKGAMLVVHANQKEISELINKYNLSIAAINAKNTLVVSGVKTSINSMQKDCENKNIKCQNLNVSHAFHSPLIEPIKNEFEQLAASIKYSQPQIPIISNVTGDFITNFNANYWCSHLLNTVLFYPSIKTVYEHDIDALIEIGPSRALASLVKFSFPDESYIGTCLKEGSDDNLIFNQLIAKLYVLGLDINWQNYYPNSVNKTCELPTYPFQRQEYWLANDEKLEHMTHNKVNLIHPLLGNKISMPINETHFENYLSCKSPNYLSCHRVYKQVVFPAAAIIETALAAISQGGEKSNLILKDVFVANALVLTETARLIHTTINEENITIHIKDDDKEYWQLLASAKNCNDTLPYIKRFNHEIMKNTFTPKQETSDEIYANFSQFGLDYTGSFRAINKLYTNLEWQCLGDISIDDNVGEDYVIHPSLLDSCFQVIIGLLNKDDFMDNKGIYVPIFFKSIYFIRKPLNHIWVHVSIKPFDIQHGQKIHASITVQDGDGVCLYIDELVCHRVAAELFGVEKQQEQINYQLNWLNKPLEFNESPNNKTLLTFCNDEASTAFLSEHFDICNYLIDTSLPLNEEKIEQKLSDSALSEHIFFLFDAPTIIDNNIELDVIKPQIECLIAVAKILMKLKKEVTLWSITKNIEQDPNSLAQSVLIGALSVIQNELPQIKCIHCDFDYSSQNSGYLLKQELAVNFIEDSKIYYRNGERYVARLNHQTNDASLLTDSQIYRLSIQNAGNLNTLFLTPIIDKPLNDSDVGIRVNYSALNFRDVLTALDLYPGDAGEFGLEFVGQVGEIAEHVKSVKPGDIVMGLAQGAIANTITVSEKSIVKIPNHLSLEDCATIPVVFLTAYYCLTHLAKLKKGQKILIHAATGGVGLAAIQIAKDVGAEIYTTANPQKWSLLKRLGISNIYNSRTLDFEQEILNKTKGQGVDVILNSLSGDYITSSFNVLNKSDGKFLEIGKLGIASEQEIAAQYPHCNYHIIDLLELSKKQPVLIQALFQDIVRLFNQKKLQPLPRSIFQIAQAVEAFRYMQQAKHIGKVILSFNLFDAHKTYVISGGTGALGRKLIPFLIENGARKFLLLGRKSECDIWGQYDDRISICYKKIDMTNLLQIQKSLSVVDKLGGIFHLAGTKKDGLIVNQNWQMINDVLDAKMCGAWNLHLASKDIPHDYFVLFSSISAILGTPGQSNYAAANAFLDNLAIFRHKLKLPAHSINWGAWHNLGMANEKGVTENLNAFGMKPLSHTQGFDALKKVLARKTPQVIVNVFDWDKFASIAGEKTFFIDLINKTKKESQSSQLLEQLHQCPRTNRKKQLQQFMQAEIAQVLAIEHSTDVDLDMSFFDLNMDSLTGVELTNRLQKALQFNLSPTVVFNYPTPNKLLGYIMANVFDSGYFGSDNTDVINEKAQITIDEKTVLDVLSLIEPQGERVE
jgi:acyl transferase domain-containing protein/NADPH:quinone reductase-like Zn-dependent oxidoreductase/acyl carrier protein